MSQYKGGGQTDRPEPRAGEPRRVLLMISGDIADVVRTTPYIKAMRQHYPSSVLAVLVSERGAAALRNCPYLDELIVRPVSQRSASRWRYRVNKVTQFVFTLRQLWRRFDVIISFLGSDATGPLWHLLAFCSGAPTRIGFDIHRTGRLLTRNLGPSDESEQTEERLDRLVAVLGARVPADDPYLDFWPTNDDHIYAASLLQQHGMTAEDVVVAVCPGSDWSCQEWSLDRWAQVGDALTEQLGARLVVLGVARERHLAEEIARVARYPVIDLTGQTTLGQLAGILSRCHLALTLESAPAALALAVGTPTVALYGSIPVWIKAQHRGPAIGMRVETSSLPSVFTVCKLHQMRQAVHRCENDLCIGGDGLTAMTVGPVLDAARGLLIDAPPRGRKTNAGPNNG